MTLTVDRRGEKECDFKYGLLSIVKHVSVCTAHYSISKALGNYHIGVYSLRDISSHISPILSIFGVVINLSLFPYFPRP